MLIIFLMLSKELGMQFKFLLCFNKQLRKLKDSKKKKRKERTSWLIILSMKCKFYVRHHQRHRPFIHAGCWRACISWHFESDLEWIRPRQPVIQLSRHSSVPSDISIWRNILGLLPLRCASLWGNTPSVAKMPTLQGVPRNHWRMGIPWPRLLSE